MKYFGPKPWGPAIDEPSMMIEGIPAGLACSHCGEPIGDDDSGTITPCADHRYDPPTFAFLVRHRECFMRDVVGSVGHLERRCSCFGGVDDDPPGMTKRQAARAALELAERLWARGRV